MRCCWLYGVNVKWCQHVFCFIFMISSVMPCIDLRQQTICQTWMTLNIHMVLTCTMLAHSFAFRVYFIRCVENARWLVRFCTMAFSIFRAFDFGSTIKKYNLHMNFLSTIVFFSNSVRIRNSGLSLWSQCSSTTAQNIHSTTKSGCLCCCGSNGGVISVLIFASFWWDYMSIAMH